MFMQVPKESVRRHHPGCDVTGGFDTPNMGADLMSQVVLIHPTWGLGTELEFSGRTIGTLNP